MKKLLVVTALLSVGAVHQSAFGLFGGMLKSPKKIAENLLAKAQEAGVMEKAKQLKGEIGAKVSCDKVRNILEGNLGDKGKQVHKAACKPLCFIGGQAGKALDLIAQVDKDAALAIAKGCRCVCKETDDPKAEKQLADFIEKHDAPAEEEVELLDVTEEVDTDEAPPVPPRTDLGETEEVDTPAETAAE